MSIKIQLQDDFIPFDLGGKLEIRFYITDESILKVRKGYQDIQKEFEAIEKETETGAFSDELNIEKSKEVLRKGYDFFFGEGTFDKVYEISPSVVNCKDLFNRLSNALVSELDKRVKGTNEEKVNKYLQNKKRNNKNKRKK